MKKTTGRRNVRPPTQSSRRSRVHCDQHIRRLRKARKLSVGKLWRWLARMPHVQAALQVAEVMFERGILSYYRVVHGTLRVCPVEGNMQRAWPQA